MGDIKSSVSFKKGWDKAREDGFDISPELRKSLIEDLGIHPDCVRSYVDAMMDNKGSKPDVNDYKMPVVVSFSNYER